MKICLHTIWEIGQKYIGGTERFLINLSKELEIFGHEPFIVCSSKTEETYVEGVKVLGRFGIKKEYNFDKYSCFSSKFIKQEIIGEKYSTNSLKRLSEYTQTQIEDIDADIFHFNSFISASFLTPKPYYIVTNHENNLEYDGYWGNGFFNFFKREVSSKRTNLHKFNYLFTPSFHYADYFSKAFNFKINAINLGVPLSYFIIQNKENELRKEYSFDENEVIVLLPSRFQPFQKGHDIALEACSILKQRNISFKIIFTGVKKSSEKYKSEFEKMVWRYNLQKNVKVITFSDIREAYRNIDVVISPERYCSYGLAISEALSLGIPTILSDIPTYKEIAKGFEHAIFFKSESANDLASKIIFVIDTLNRNREEAINFRMKNDIRECAKKYSEIYLKISNN